MITLLTILTVCIAATVPPVKVTGDGAVGTSRFDVQALLPSGAATGATGTNAVSAVADDESGAVGAKGENAVLGMASPGMAVGLGTGLQGFGSIFGSPSTEVAGSPNNPAATPVANNFFNFFN